MNANFDIISHRGYIEGCNQEFENNPDHLEHCFERYPWMFFEIDVWKIGNNFYLGHDEPIYKVYLDFLYNKKFYIHAKNLNAFEFLYQNKNANLFRDMFYHDKDDVTMTLSGKIWCNKKIWVKNSILNQVSEETINLYDYNHIGICTDFPLKVKKYMDHLYG